VRLGEQVPHLGKTIEVRHSAPGVELIHTEIGPAFEGRRLGTRLIAVAPLGSYFCGSPIDPLRGLHGQRELAAVARLLRLPMAKTCPPPRIAHGQQRVHDQVPDSSGVRAGGRRSTGCRRAALSGLRMLPTSSGRVSRRGRIRRTGFGHLIPNQPPMLHPLRAGLPQSNRAGCTRLRHTVVALRSHTAALGHELGGVDSPRSWSRARRASSTRELIPSFANTWRR